MTDTSTTKTIATNAAECRTKLAPVYCRFDGQTQPQPAYLELDPQKRTLTADYSGEIGNAVPMTVWHGHQYRLSITPYLTGAALADLLEDEDVLTLVAEVIDGHSIEWDGSNHVGRLTEDAADALEGLQESLDRNAAVDTAPCVSVYTPEEWVEDTTQVDIAAETTDARLAEIAAECIADAELEHVLIEGGVSDMLARLTKLRNALCIPDSGYILRDGRPLAVRIDTDGDLADATTGRLYGYSCDRGTDQWPTVYATIEEAQEAAK